MTFRRLVLWTVLLAIFTMAVRISVDSDTWWHLAAGRWMIDQHQVLRTDPFSFTRFGEAWVNPSWLAQLVLFLTHQAAGVQGLNLLTAWMVTLAFASVWPLLGGPALMRGFVLIACATASGVYWSARPQIFTFALTGLLLLLLEKGRTRHRYLFGVPVLMALWANVHGGFAIGLILIALEIAAEVLTCLGRRAADGVGWKEIWQERRSRMLRWSGVLAASLAAVVANPYGVRLLRYPLDTISIGPLQALIDEWQSPDFHQPETWPFLALLLACVGILALSPMRKRVRDLLLMSALTVLALLARRNIALFALGVAPIVGVHLWAVLEPLVRRMPARGRQVSPALGRALNVLILACVSLAAGLKISLPLSSERIAQAIANQQPLGAMAFLQSAKPPGPLLNSYTWGGYLVWELWPAYRTFVDGRTDLFAGDVLNDYVDAWNATSRWPEVIARYDIRLALLERSAPLTHALRADGWATLYEDRQAVVLASTMR